MTVLNHTLGFPRIGKNRELKKSLEDYWSGNCNIKELIKVGYELRIRHWEQQKNMGVNLIPVGDFSWYDNVLSTSMMLNNIPLRHKYENINLIDMMFRIARGTITDNGLNISAAEMTKWFDTNYHYIVPELTINQQFSFSSNQLIDEVDEAISLGHKIKPILIGPISYLWLGKVKGKLFDRLSLLPELIKVYKEILNKLLSRKIEWIQIDEPILVLELPDIWKKSFLPTYSKLNGRINILLTTYFDSISHQLNIIKKLPIQGLHVDLVSGKDNLLMLHKELPENWILSAGIINGRNIWRTNLYFWFKQLQQFLNYRNLWIGTSCSLLHCPIDINNEKLLNEKNKKNLSFSLQKCMELNLLSNTLNDPSDLNLSIINNYSKSIINKQISKLGYKKIDFSFLKRKDSFIKRKQKQKLRFNLPILPTTTIGSFPQTTEIRKLRMNYFKGNLDESTYNSKIKEYIKKIIKEQEDLDIDVLVHGEVERNDMVEYFSKYLDGFIITQNGWVQSYGSRCVKPPIIIGDIKRNKDITVKWTSYAQSLTKKPVKGMITGPITMFNWSFNREDISKEIVVQQIALALREEVADLEKSGIGIIQIDEPALREGLPLKKSKWHNYLNWATEAFRISSSVVKEDTQIHTHMCYCQFDKIINYLILLDADVITIESSRSEMNVLKKFKKINYPNDIGPGIYDIHSPNIPDSHHLVYLLRKAIKLMSVDQLWVNPDCGLKTRKWEEIIPSLSRMILSTKIIRKEILFKKTI